MESNPEIKTQRDTIIESTAMKVTITEAGIVCVSTTFATINNADDLLLAARTLTHAAEILKQQQSK